MVFWYWLGAIVFFGVVEGVTAGLVSIWFVLGAAAALIATRPLVKKLRAGKPVPTNLDRVIGAAGRVTETVDNSIASGAVYVDGKTWTARSADDSILPKGQMVRIVKMEGVKLFVEKLNERENVQV